jgi:hypothetical protein
MTATVVGNTPSSESIFKQLTLDALRNLPEAMREAICAAAIPRHFNGEILQVLLATETNQAVDLYRQLQQLPFVQPYGENEHTIFPFVRNVVLQQWVSNPPKYVEYNERLASFYHQKCGLDEKWPRVDRIEAIYHDIAVDESIGFIRFEREFLRSLEFAQYDHCSYLLRAVEERRSGLRLRSQLWFDFYCGILAERLEKWQEAISRYKALEAQNGWPTELRPFLISKLVELPQKFAHTQVMPKQMESLPDLSETLSHSLRPDFDIESEIRMLEDFYRQKQAEAKSSFVLALTAGGIGFVIIVVGIVGAFFWNTQIGIVTSAAGILSEVAASLLLNQNKHAREGMDVCQKDLVKMRNLSRALHIAKIGIASQKEREKRISEIIDELIGTKRS